jgi:hypothetical protein
VALAGLSVKGVTTQLPPQSRYQRTPRRRRPHPGNVGRWARRNQPPFTSPSFFFTPIYNRTRDVFYHFKLPYDSEPPE